MRISEIIYKDKECEKLAKQICGYEWEDYYMKALEKIIRLENKGKIKNQKNHQAFFRFCLRSVFIDDKRKRRVDLYYHDEYHIKPKEEIKEVNIYELALYNFLNNTNGDEEYQLAQVITKLTLYNTITQISIDTGYSKRVIYRYIDIAKEYIKDEFDKLMAD